MKLTKLWDLQKELDRNILETQGLIETEEMLEDKVLSLTVELAELCNEWKQFKFWKKDKTINKEKLIEEYVDCLHFVISIGNQIGEKYDKVNMFFDMNAKDSFNKMFLIAASFKPKDYWHLLTGLIELANALELRNDEIEAAYLYKNETNHKRQEEGY